IDRPALLAVAVPREAVQRISDHDFVYVEAGTATHGKLIFKRRLVTTPSYAVWRERRARPASEVFLPVNPREPELVAVWGGLSEGEKVLVDLGPARPHGPEEVVLTDSQFSAGRVATVTVEERKVADATTVGGRPTVDDLRVTHVSPPVSGQITQILAAPGQHVRKGAALAIILSPDLGSAFSDELKAKADLIAAEHELQRQREMHA